MTMTQDELQPYLDLLDEMMGSGAYDWAEDTLRGIRDWADTNAHVTDRQKAAIRRIGERAQPVWEEDLDEGRGLV